MKPGDTLSAVLGNHFHYPEHLIFNEAINAVKALNPGIRNVNQLQPGQRIIIPLSVPDGSPDPASIKASSEIEASRLVASTTEPPARSSMEEVKRELTSNKTAALTDNSIEERVVEEGGAGDTVDQEETDVASDDLVVAPPTPGERRIHVLAEAVMATVMALGGKSSNKGIYSLPLGSQGEITLESSRFPLVEFPSGEIMFLDLDDRLPFHLEEAINAVWNDRYHIINVGGNDTFRSIWQQVIQQLDKMEVWHKREPLVIDSPVQISIQGDWVLTATRPQENGENIFIVNLLRDAEERTDPALQAYLDSMGIKVVDVHLRGQLEQARVTSPMNEQAFNSSADTVVVRSRFVPDLVEAFLKVLEQPYQRGQSVRFGTAGQEGFSLTVRAGFYFQRNGNFHLIDFRRLSPSILSLLKNWRYQVLVVDPEWNTKQVFSALKEHLHLDANSSYKISVSAREPGRNIHLSLPGDLIREGKRGYLLTPLPVPPSLNDYLQRQGLGVLNYQNG